MRKITIMHLKSAMREPSAYRGAESAILSLTANLNKEKFEVIMVFLKDVVSSNLPFLSELQKNQVSTEIINLRGRYDISAVFRLRNLIRKYDVDILHCHGYKSNFFGFFVSLLCDVKRITTLHGWTKTDFKVTCYELFDRLIIMFYEKIVAVSEFTARQIINKKILQDKISVIHNSIDIEKFSFKNRNILQEEFNIPQKKCKIIGTVGKLSREKGHCYFLKAASKIINLTSEVKFIIIGHGPMRSRLEKLTAKLGLEDKVIFTGYRKDAVKLMAGFDVFVLSSLREGLPIVILEAMALGLPVVSFDIGGVSEVIDDGQDGILVSAKDFDTLAEKIAYLLKNPHQAEKIAERALNKIKAEFNIENMINKYENLYRRMLKNHE